MGEFIFGMLNNKWVVAIGTVLALLFFIVLPEVKAEISRASNGRPIREREE